MKKIWKKFLAIGISLSIALDMPFVLPVFSTDSFGAERPANVQATSLNVRSGPGTGYSVVGKLAYGAAVTVINEAAASDGALWYQIRFTGSSGGAAEGYVLASYIKFPSTYSSDADFEQYLTTQGFPESYRNGLRELHARYPQWIFTAVDTGLDWNEVIRNESLVGRNLVSSSSPTSWKSTAPGAYDWATNTWPGFDGPNWVAASEAIICYYMDPRNFLNETYIFQFLGQSYDPAIHTRDGVAALVKGTFLEGAVPVGSTWKGVSQGTAGGAGTGVASPSGGNGSPQSGSAAGSGSTGPGASGTGGTGAGTSSGSGSGASSGNGDGAVFQGPGESGTGGSSGAGIGPGYTGNLPGDVQVGVPPGTNVSRGNGSLSSSLHEVRRVSATVIRVGPGGEASPGSTGSSSGGSGSGSADPGVSSGTSSSGGTYTGGPVPYVDILMEAGIQSGVNPYVLAAMILQEQGSQGKSESISGANGYYNYFNFEAYASNGMTAVQRGLWYASQAGDYMRPWDSVDKAIIGGACQYGQNYVQAGQNTFYLKKFNVQGSNLYKHQYMTNVEGAAAEGAKMAGAYSESMRQSPMQFMIPVFRNMPAESCAKPSSNGSANNFLSSISVDGFALSPAFSQDTYYYEVSVNTAVSSVMLRALAADSTAQVSGTGTINLNQDITDVKVIVTAQNGVAKEYTIRFIRNGSAAAGSGTAGSGQGQAGSTGASGSGNLQGGPGFGTPAGNQGSAGTETQGGPGGSNVTIVY